MVLSSPCLPGLFQPRTLVGKCKWEVRKVEPAVVALFFFTGVRKDVMVFQKGHPRLEFQINSKRDSLVPSTLCT